MIRWRQGARLAVRLSRSLNALCPRSQCVYVYFKPSRIKIFRQHDFCDDSDLKLQISQSRSLHDLRSMTLKRYSLQLVDHGRSRKALDALIYSHPKNQSKFEVIGCRKLIAPNELCSLYLSTVASNFFSWCSHLSRDFLEDHILVAKSFTLSGRKYGE